jgi:hypothetical protein
MGHILTQLRFVTCVLVFYGNWDMTEARARSSAYSRLRDLSRSQPNNERERSPQTQRGDVRVSGRIRRLAGVLWTFATLSITLLVLIVVAWRVDLGPTAASPGALTPPPPKLPIAESLPQPAHSSRPAQGVRPSAAPTNPIEAARGDTGSPIQPAVSPASNAAAGPGASAKTASEASDGASSQIGALAAPSLADQTWSGLSRSMPKLFSGKSEAVQAVSHNGDILYRSLVVGFSSRTEAVRFCATLRGAGHPCLVR